MIQIISQSSLVGAVLAKTGLYLCTILFLFEFKLSSAHLLVVVGVAAVTLAFGVEFAQTSMFATCSHGGSPVSMIAWIAHAHRVVRQISMLAGRDHSLFLSRVSF